MSWRSGLAIIGLLLIAFFGGAYRLMIWMPGSSYSGDLPELTTEQQKIAENLKGDVVHLATKIGERNLHNQPGALEESAQFITDRFREFGYQPEEQTFSVHDETVKNIYVCETPLKKITDDVIVVGAHYDTVQGSPGANDNGSGVASMLQLAKQFRDRTTGDELCFVAFVNEEPPYFTTENMGSYQFARALKDHDISVRVMMSLETIGYYSNQPGSQGHIFPLQYIYPNRGNFITFVGNVWRGGVVREAIDAFRADTKFPSEGITAPSIVPGISWSDHRSFWKFGYPAFMVTDTAPYRYPHYHTYRDRPQHLDYGKMARVTSGIVDVIEGFSSG